MNIDATFFVLASLWMVIAFVGFIIYAWRDGQFKDVEEDQMHLLEDD